MGDAGTYRRRYFERLDFLHLVDYCLTLAGIHREHAMRVLDIGSGGDLRLKKKLCPTEVFVFAK